MHDDFLEEIIEEERALKGSEAYTLYKKGKDTWNEWARVNEGRGVSFQDVVFEEDMNFEGYIFPGFAFFGKATFTRNADFTRAAFTHNADFSNARFTQRAMFDGATFGGKAHFRNTAFISTATFMRATFGDEVGFIQSCFSDTAGFTYVIFNQLTNFNQAEFQRGAYFMNVRFEKDVMFQRCKFSYNDVTVTFFGSHFKQATEIDSCEFEYVPDFRSTIFDKGISLYSAQVKYQSVNDNFALGWLGKARENHDSDKYRRHKDLAVLARDREREQMFFAYELKAKRFYETKGVKLIPNLLYDWLSDYGQSVLKPFEWLMLTLLSFSYLYFFTSIQQSSLNSSELVWRSLVFSTSQLLPFLSSARNAQTSIEHSLYPDGIPEWLYIFTLIENFLGFIFIFLMGLALRNRFKI